MKTKELAIVVVVLVTGFAFPNNVAADEQVTSKFTSTARAKSISFKEDKGETTAGFKGVFPGLGGYQLVHLSGDERSWINIRYGTTTVDLYSATMKVGPGAFPHKENDVAEWRGLQQNGRFTPYAVIYRLAGYDEERRLHKTRLVVIKLDKERSAILGYAEGANEDAEAKQLADKARPH